MDIPRREHPQIGVGYGKSGCQCTKPAIPPKRLKIEQKLVLKIGINVTHNVRFEVLCTRFQDSITFYHVSADMMSTATEYQTKQLSAHYQNLSSFPVTAWLSCYYWLLMHDIVVLLLSINA